MDTRWPCDVRLSSIFSDESCSSRSRRRSRSCPISSAACLRAPSSSMRSDSTICVRRVTSLRCAYGDAHMSIVLVHQSTLPVTRIAQCQCTTNKGKEREHSAAKHTSSAERCSRSLVSRSSMRRRATICSFSKAAVRSWRSSSAMRAFRFSMSRCSSLTYSVYD